MGPKRVRWAVIARGCGLRLVVDLYFPLSSAELTNKEEGTPRQMYLRAALVGQFRRRESANRLLQSQA